MKAFDLLNGMTNDTTYVTTRGTVGDGDCTIIVDREFVENYGNEEVVSLPEVQKINAKAYQDIVDFIKTNCPGTSADEYSVIIKDCQYILVW